LAPPDTLLDPVLITAGNTHSCALDRGGVTCWEDDYYGQSSVPPGLLFSDLGGPVAVPALSPGFRLLLVASLMAVGVAVRVREGVLPAKR
jgi:hypothetical protein